MSKFLRLSIVSMLALALSPFTFTANAAELNVPYADHNALHTVQGED